MFGNLNWKYQNRAILNRLHKKNITKSIIIFFIVIAIVLASIFSSIYLVEINRMRGYGNFIISNVSMTSFSSISVSYQIDLYDSSMSCYFDGRIDVNNWSIRWNGLLQKNGIIEVQNIPLSSIIPYFELDIFDIRIYGNYIEKLMFSYSKFLDLHYFKSFKPDISCGYHEVQFLDLVDITFSTAFNSPVLNVGGVVSISYNAMVNVTSEEIYRGMLNMESKFYSAGNVSILRSFENSFVVINATSTYNFNINVYDPPDALWTFVIAERLNHKISGYPDTDPCVLIANFSICCGGFTFNFPSWYIEVDIV